MASHRNNLTLDEPSFQGLLAAAFTIQEHNDRRSREARAPEITPAPVAAESPTSCPHCGASKPANESRCLRCGGDEFRPGERLQRNWASMWLMSQDQGLWLERSPENSDARLEPRTSHAPPVTIARARPTQIVLDSACNGVLARPIAKAAADATKETTAAEESGATAGRLRVSSPRPDPAIAPPVLDDPIADDTAADRTWPLIKAHHSRHDDLGEEEASSALQPGQFSRAEDITLDVADADVADAGAADAGAALEAPRPGPAAAPRMRRLADWRVILRFHRADLYLGLAVFVALTALLWPAASSPHPPALGLAQRALVKFGIAEAPVPVTLHLQGDPGIEVWVDPHTALYYCPGEERYGKISDGHFTSQRDAQMDRFEPASRSACE